ncbi:beta-1,4-galactosyltransferase 4-like [Sycon ciliatum]|uniref:beta-1,4-galactosyltransferase 4-like n=1 Tax=Sycon ciliatum TaxID=27933 RepID=UPI0031F6F3B5
MSSTCRCCVLTVAVEITSAQCLKFPGCCSGKGSQLNAPSSWRDSLLFLAAGFVLAVLWTGPGIYSGQPQNTDVLWWPFLGSRGPGCHLLDLNQSRIEQHLLLMTVGQRSSVTRRTLGSSLVKSGDQAAAAPASAGTAGSSGNKTSSSSSNNSNNSTGSSGGGRSDSDGTNAVTGKSRVAILVPYRNRGEQLATFIPAIYRFLSRQDIEFEIFIVNQLGTAKFNRGALLNIGYVEANRDRARDERFDCVALHDIDLIPVHDGNSYDCGRWPRVKAWQLSTAIDIHYWRLPAGDADGGVNLVQAGAFEEANGFNNRFYGWGGEDNDFKRRLQSVSGGFEKRSAATGRYCAIRKAHRKSKQVADDRFALLRNYQALLVEGVATIKYRLLRRADLRLYTMVDVELWQHEDEERTGRADTETNAGR